MYIKLDSKEEERTDAPRGTVYLLHFDRPYQHAQHYCGWVDGDLDAVRERLTLHANSRGAKLLAVIRDAGIPWRVVKIIRHATRHTERRMKNRGGLGRVCPVCRGEPVDVPLDFHTPYSEEP